MSCSPQSDPRNPHRATGATRGLRVDHGWSPKRCRARDQACREVEMERELSAWHILPHLRSVQESSYWLNWVFEWEV